MLANQRTPIMQAAHVRRLRSRARRCESLARVARSYDETMRLLGLRAAYLIEAAIAAKVEQAAHHVSDSADNRPEMEFAVNADRYRPEWVICDHCGEVFGYEDDDNHRCAPVDEEPRCQVCGDWERFHAEGCPRHPQYRGYATVGVADDEVVPW